MDHFKPVLSSLTLRNSQVESKNQITKCDLVIAYKPLFIALSFRLTAVVASNGKLICKCGAHGPQSPIYHYFISVWQSAVFFDMRGENTCSTTKFPSPQGSHHRKVVSFNDLSISFYYSQI
jgi:hypothetical protein